MAPAPTQSFESSHGMTLPNGTEVASYATYAEAQAGVDYLVEKGFNVRDITIVGTDLHMVEHITGRLSPLRVAFSGASSGLMWGGFFGLLMSFANQGLPGLVWVAIGAAGGALVGMAMALLSYVLRGGSRDFVSHSHVIASRYAVLASSSAQQAFDLLQKTPGNQRRPAPAPVRASRRNDGAPTEYGSRPDEKPRYGVRLSDLPAESEPAADSVPVDSASAEPTQN